MGSRRTAAMSGGYRREGPLRRTRPTTEHGYRRLCIPRIHVAPTVAGQGCRRRPGGNQAGDRVFLARPLCLRLRCRPLLPPPRRATSPSPATGTPVVGVGVPASMDQDPRRLSNTFSTSTTTTITTTTAGLLRLPPRPPPVGLAIHSQ